MSSGGRGMRILDSMGNTNQQKNRTWTKEEILKMWPQAAGELRGFQAALEKGNAGITADQLEMALQLADAEFKRMNSEKGGDGVMQFETHGFDTDKQVFFYEHEFYVLSNFSAFAVEWKGFIYPTSEHVYHSEKFEDEGLKELIRNACSAHDALKLAHTRRGEYKYNWDEIKLTIMKEILRTKAIQHPYIMKKLLESGNRELIENSWRDSFWGRGPNKDGKNYMGKLWMELRDEFSKLELKD